MCDICVDINLCYISNSYFTCISKLLFIWYDSWWHS